MTGVAITDRAQQFVVGPDKRRAGANATGRLHDGSVELKGQLEHGSGLVDVVAGKHLCSHRTKSLLRGRNDILIFLMASGNIQQSEEH